MYGQALSTHVMGFDKEPAVELNTAHCCLTSTFLIVAVAQCMVSTFNGDGLTNSIVNSISYAKECGDYHCVSPDRHRNCRVPIAGLALAVATGSALQDGAQHRHERNGCS